MDRYDTSPVSGTQKLRGAAGLVAASMSSRVAQINAPTSPVRTAQPYSTDASIKSVHAMSSSTRSLESGYAAKFEAVRARAGAAVPPTSTARNGLMRSPASAGYPNYELNAAATTSQYGVNSGVDQRHHLQQRQQGLPGGGAAYPYPQPHHQMLHNPSAEQLPVSVAQPQRAAGMSAAPPRRPPSPNIVPPATTTGGVARYDDNRSHQYGIGYSHNYTHATTGGYQLPMSAAASVAPRVSDTLVASNTLVGRAAQPPPPASAESRVVSRLRGDISTAANSNSRGGGGGAASPQEAASSAYPYVAALMPNLEAMMGDDADDGGGYGGFRSNGYDVGGTRSGTIVRQHGSRSNYGTMATLSRRHDNEHEGAAGECELPATSTTVPAPMSPGHASPLPRRVPAAVPTRQSTVGGGSAQLQGGRPFSSASASSSASSSLQASTTSGLHTRHAAAPQPFAAAPSSSRIGATARAPTASGAASGGELSAADSSSSRSVALAAPQVAAASSVVYGGGTARSDTTRVSKLGAGQLLHDGDRGTGVAAASSSSPSSSSRAVAATPHAGMPASASSSSASGSAAAQGRQQRTITRADAYASDSRLSSSRSATAAASSSTSSGRLAAKGSSGRSLAVTRAANIAEEEEQSRSSHVAARTPASSAATLPRPALTRSQSTSSTTSAVPSAQPSSSSSASSSAAALKPRQAHQEPPPQQQQQQRRRLDAMVTRSQGPPSASRRRLPSPSESKGYDSSDDGDDDDDDGPPPPPPPRAGATSSSATSLARANSVGSQGAPKPRAVTAAASATAHTSTPAVTTAGSGGIISSLMRLSLKLGSSAAASAPKQLRPQQPSPAATDASNNASPTATGSVSGNSGSSSGSSQPRVPSQPPLQQQPQHRVPPSSPRGLCGLANLGNTCFMNSTLQCLSNVPRLTDYFAFSDAWQREANASSRRQGGKGGEMAAAYADLMARMWRDGSSGIGTVERPARVKTTVGAINKMFNGYDQHDAQEFLRFLLDALHDDCNRIQGKLPYVELTDPADHSDADISDVWWRYYQARNASHVVDCFSGQLKTETVCKRCGHRSRAFDPFMDLSVPIPKNAQVKERSSVNVGGRGYLFAGLEDSQSSDDSGPMSARSGACDLQQCLQAFTAPEVLDEGTWYCSKCKAHQPGTKKMTLFRLPNTLVLHLKRFSFGTFRRSKITTNVDFPVSGLDLTPYLADKCEFVAPARRNCYLPDLNLLHQLRSARLHPMRSPRKTLEGDL